MKSVPAVAATARACQIHRGSWPREIRATRICRSSPVMTSPYRIMKLVIAVNARGTCRRSSAWSRSRTSVVATSRPVAATPSVPLIRMFHAPHSPGTDNDIPSTSVCGLVPMTGRSTANATNGSSIARRRANTENGMRAIARDHDEERGVHAERPERVAGRRDDGEHEGDGRDELALGRERVDRRRARDEQWTVLTGAHGQPDAVSGDVDATPREPAERRRATNQRPPNSARR